MLRTTCVAVAAAAAVAASCVSASTIAVARGSGTGTATSGAQPVKPPTVVPPSPAPAQFNSPGSQAAPLRSGNPANQETSMSLIAPKGWAPPSGGRPIATHKGKQSDVPMTDQKVDSLLKYGICRGC